MSRLLNEERQGDPNLLVHRILFLLIILMCIVAPAFAQNNEISASVTFVRANPNFSEPNFRFDKSTDQVGFEAAYTRYFGDSPFGIKFDGGMSFRDDTDSSLLTLMAGPTVKARGRRFQPFAHALVGAGRFDATSRQASFSFDKSTSGIAYAVGGGLDIKVNNNFAIRALQADYLTNRILDKNVRYLRAGAGVVFSW